MVAPVWEGDAVAIKSGYHYNVASPGTKTGFLWMMAAVREETDRVFTLVTVQPEFDGRLKLFCSPVGAGRHARIALPSALRARSDVEAVGVGDPDPCER